MPGAGKTTAVKQFLETLARSKPVPPDWCYVHDFNNIERPNAVRFPAGQAVQFKLDMENLLHSMVQDIRAAFESEEYLKQREVQEILETSIRQGIAVTGSVNQKGEIQANGGVNDKIKGFYEVCKARGLAGDQGVVIPSDNVENLMLKECVVEAVREGKFHIWPVVNIEEGIEILTGTQAGKRTLDGSYEAGSVFARVASRLERLAEALAEYGREGTLAGRKSQTE